MKLAVSVTTAAIPATETTPAVASEMHDSVLSAPDAPNTAGVLMHVVNFAMNAAMASGKQVDAISVRILRD